ncbi:lipid-binding SYLF domain-containing protein [Gilvimarinus agarilyticus]|uniref:lipid-binding SYLF domain-containing protein n=1 Tax=Gilvimarinus agarilyticus TaxID=679259 RepID=UPI00059F432B|nr:YSC84-related protein [Gilvimarinus agarilyticus]
MKKVLHWALLALATVCLSAQADPYQDTVDTFKSSPQVVHFFQSAYGYAIFPTIGKGGIGIGGAHGKGRVYRNGQMTGTTSMTQLSIGFQLGGQAFSEIIFFENKRSFDDFTEGNFEFGAQASAVAITAGANAKIGTTGMSAGASGVSDKAGKQTALYNAGVAVFTHAKGGLMYEAALSGQKFSYQPAD